MGFLLEEYEEPSVKTWFFMSSPYPLLAILVTYLWFCVIAGPSLMKNRKPFQLTKVLIVYNLFQVIFNTYIVIRIIFEVLPHINFTCEPIADSNTSTGRQFIWLTYGIFWVKVIELCETILFVLRKKFNQVSTLHLYHHAAIPFWGWMITKFFPGGNTWFFILLNMTVHSVMYSYYFVAALGPQYQKYLWWKKYITILQIVQFILVFAHSFQGLFRDCKFPKTATLAICLQSVMFFIMFGQFYLKAYINPKNSQVLPKGECIIKGQ